MLGKGDGKMVLEQRLKELPKAIIKWYGIEKGSKAACITVTHGNSRVIAEALEEKGVCTTSISLEAIACGQEEEKDICPCAICNECTYDMVVVVDVLEYASNVPWLLSCIKKMLKPDGKLLLAADNRLGIRYFCGDQDAFSGKNYDGIENYKHLQAWEWEELEGRAYSKAELIRFLEGAGFCRHRFFSVFPRISNPQLLLAEDYEPNEALDIRVFPEYNNPSTVFLFEEELYPSLMENKLLHPMANGFFIECPLQPQYVPVRQVTLSGERGIENAMATIIRSDGLVEKRVLYPEGRRKLEQLLMNHQYLLAHGVGMVEMELTEDALLMPYVSGIPATDYLRRLLEQDKDSFLNQLDAFWNIILHSSEPIPFQALNWKKIGFLTRKSHEDWEGEVQNISESQKEELGVILKRGYLDLVSLNCFYFDGKFIFYDQELYLENVPAKAIMLRTIEFLYKFHDQLDNIIPRTMLFERYGLIKYKELYEQYITHFLNVLRCDDGLSDYYQRERRDGSNVAENRKWINYSKKEYHKIFMDIFHDIEGRKLYLFGSGKYAQRFREQYGEVYPVSGYLDNDEKRWGKEIDGQFVYSLDILQEMDPNEYKVMICIRNYMPVVKQLRKVGISNFSVYDPAKIY